MPFPPFPILTRVPHGFIQDPSTDHSLCAAIHRAGWPRRDARPPVNRAPDLEGSALPVVRRLGTPATATSPLAGRWLLAAERWLLSSRRWALGVAAVAAAVAAIHSRWLPRSSPLRASVSGLFGSISSGSDNSTTNLLNAKRTGGTERTGGSLLWGGCAVVHDGRVPKRGRRHHGAGRLGGRGPSALPKAWSLPSCRCRFPLVPLPPKSWPRLKDTRSGRLVGYHSEYPFE